MQLDLKTYLYTYIYIFIYIHELSICVYYIHVSSFAERHVRERWLQKSPCSQPLYIDIGFAGGDTGRFLAETEAWIRAHGVGNKTLGAEMWDALSAEAKSKHPRVVARHAMLKMCFVEKDQMNLSVNDVKRMLNTPAVQEALSRAEEYMTSMRKVREKSTRTPECWAHRLCGHQAHGGPF